MLELSLMRHTLSAAIRGVLARKLDRIGDLLHTEVANITERRSTRGAARELRAAIRAHDVTRLTLHDGRQCKLEAHRALE